MNNVLNFIITSLDIAGVVLLIGSLFPMIKLIRELPAGLLQKQWKILFGLVWFFIAIYIYISFEHRHNTLFMNGEVYREAICLVLFFGALFVFLVNTLSLKTALDVKRIYALEMEVAKRRTMEETLHKGEARIAAAQHVAKLGCWELNLVNNKLWWSDEIFRIFEIDPTKFGASYEAFLDAIHPDDRDAVNLAYTNSLKERSSYEIEHRLLLPDGRIKYVHEHCKHEFDSNKKPLRSSGTVQDITERKIATEAVSASEKKFRDLVESISDWVWEIDEKGRYTYCSPRVSDMLGYDPSELIGKSPFELMPPDEATRVATLFGPIIAKQGVLKGLENTSIHKNGRRIVLETSGAPIFDADGTFKGYRGIDRDITDRKLSEIALAQSESTSRALINATAETAILIDEKGAVLGINEIGADRFHKKQDEIIGTNIYDLMPPDIANSRKALIDQVFKSGKSTTFHDVRNGIHFDNNLYPVFNAQNKVISLAVYAADVTEQLQLRGIDQLFNKIDLELLQGTSLDTIFKFICTDIAKVFDYKYTWIASKEEDGSVAVRADAGQADGYRKELEQAKVRWDVPQSDCPTVVSILTGQMQMFKLSDEGFEHVRESAKRHNIGAILSLPLIVNEKIYGALTLCSEYEDGFKSPDIIQRLSSLTASICLSLEMAKEQQQMTLLSTALSATANGVLITDKTGRTLWINRAFTTLTGYSKTDIQGLTPHLLYSGKQGSAFYKNLWQTIMRGEVWHDEIIERRKDGSEFFALQTITPMHDADGKLSNFIAILEDISIEKEIEARVEHMAHYDSLTNIPNRVLFLDRLEQALALAQRHKQQFALMFIDLDYFKEINDTLGHDMGDVVIKETAIRLQACIRKMDTVARMGGDEFTVIVTDIKTSKDAELVAKNILKALTEPFELKGKAGKIGCSIGIAIYPMDATDSKTLLKHADDAMYDAKKERNAICIFSDTLG